MVVIGTQSSIELMSRYFVSDVNLEITNENERIIQNQDLTMVDNGNYNELDISAFDFVDKTSYKVIVKDNSNDEEIFRGKLFYTLLTSEPNYSRNIGDYKEKDNNKKYIIYER